MSVDAPSVIVILASEFDSIAQHAAAKWPGGAARVMTPADLSCGGWQVEAGRLADAVVVVAGELLRMDAVRGWINLLPVVWETELARIDPIDRRYAAAEMSAFLTYLLSEVRDRVVNQSSATELTGPGWSYEKWILEAARAGLPVRSWTVDSHEQLPARQIKEVVFCTVLGSKTWGSDSSTRQLYGPCERLAASAKSNFLRVYFEHVADEDYFLSAHTVAPLDEPQMVEALHQHFIGS